MRFRGGVVVFVGALFVASPAMADDGAAPPAAAAVPDAAPNFIERLFGTGAALRDLASDLLARFVVEQRSEFDRMADRYIRLVEFTKKLEERDEADFNAKAERYMRLRRFTTKLEAEQVERETHQFEAQVALFLREAAFTQELEHRRAESAGPVDAIDPARWRLYERK